MGRLGMRFPALRNKTDLAHLENVTPFSLAAARRICASSSLTEMLNELRRFCLIFSTERDGFSA